MNIAMKNKKSKEEKPKKTFKQELISWILTLAAAVAIGLVIRTFLFVPVKVKGESMQNTLMNKEIVLATKYDYLSGDFHRRDIVICHYPDRGGTLFIKRLIALPGDTIEMHGGELYVNGELVNESDIDMNTPFTTNLGPYTLGEDEYFVMGDNRGNSNDSRAVGPLTRKMIVGHVQRVIYPFNKFWDKAE